MLNQMAKLGEGYSLPMATKSKKYEYDGQRKPLLSENTRTTEEVIDKTGKPKQIDEKINEHCEATKIR